MAGTPVDHLLGFTSLYSFISINGNVLSDATSRYPVSSDTLFNMDFCFHFGADVTLRICHCFLFSSHMLVAVLFDVQARK
jgi:hypothetical protein